MCKVEENHKKTKEKEEREMEKIKSEEKRFFLIMNTISIRLEPYDLLQLTLKNYIEDQGFNIQIFKYTI